MRHPRTLPGGEKALDGTHEGVEVGACIALPEVSSGETADKAVDAKSTHVLVAETQACVRKKPMTGTQPCRISLW
jgi:hypothetical protein